MSARCLQNFACVKFSGYGSYVTMPQAVALMQPRRVLVTFGTNDLSPNYSAASFTENYRAGLQAIADAYPAADIIRPYTVPTGKKPISIGTLRSSEYLKLFFIIFFCIKTSPRSYVEIIIKAFIFFNMPI